MNADYADTTNLSEFTFAHPPRAVGGYQLGGPRGIRLMLTRRPHGIARFLCRWLLDWQWVDMPDGFGEMVLGERKPT